MARKHKCYFWLTLPYAGESIKIDQTGWWALYCECLSFGRPYLRIELGADLGVTHA